MSSIPGLDKNLPFRQKIAEILVTGYAEQKTFVDGEMLYLPRSIEVEDARAIAAFCKELDRSLME